MIKIPLTKGKSSFIDDEDFELIEKYKWHYSQGYAYHGRLSMHKLLLGVKHGKMIDHINGNGIDNRKSNLRFCTLKENNRNRIIQINNKSGYKGVVFAKIPKKWKAILRTDSKSLSLGYFNNKTDAAKCYDFHARKLFGEFAKTNFDMV